MRNAKRNTLLGLTLGAVIALAAWTQAWFTFDISEGAAVSQVVVAGTDSRPLISALTLGTFAAVASLLLAGKVVRLIVLSATLFLGFGGLVSAVSASTDPIAASLTRLSAVTGLGDIGTVSAVVATSAQTSGWIVCAAGCSLIVISSIFGMITHRRWQRPTDRFNRPENETEFRTAKVENFSEGDSWDSLSRGEDPTR